MANIFDDSEGSKPLTLKEHDWKKIGKGLLIAIGGAGLTYLQDILLTIDFGEWTPIVVALNSVLINIIRKWIIDTRE